MRVANLVLLRRSVLSRAFSSLAPLESSRTQVQVSKTPKEKTANEKLVFGKFFTDHMLEIDWDAQSGWQAPQIRPHGPLTLDPAASALHYGLQAFEGMKAYIDDNGKTRLFRPDMNMKRLNNSAKRLGFPAVDGNEFMECIKKLVLLDKSWIPRADGYSLYLRPTYIATHPFLGVAAPQRVKLYTILSPVGPYYPEGFNPVRLYADNTFVRAWPGGTGDTKIGPNYAGTIMPQSLAAKKGYTQIMWLFNNEVTEVGTMNMFFFWKNKQGKLELVTPQLDGTILPGVTRDSILTLARTWNEFEVSERKITINEVIESINEGRLIEVFGAGTAAIVSPVCGFHYSGKDYQVPLDVSDPKAKAGKLTKRFWDTIISIQYGRTPFRDWSVVID